MTTLYPMKVTVAVLAPTVVLVSVLPLVVSMLVMSSVCGLFVPPAARQAIALVNVTGVNFASAVLVSSPPSGSSMIHSTELPLKLALVGGATVNEVCKPVVIFAK